MAPAPAGSRTAWHFESLWSTGGAPCAASTAYSHNPQQTTRVAELRFQRVSKAQRTQPPDSPASPPGPLSACWCPLSRWQGESGVRDGTAIVTRALRHARRSPTLPPACPGGPQHPALRAPRQPQVTRPAAPPPPLPPAAATPMRRKAQRSIMGAHGSKAAPNEAAAQYPDLHDSMAYIKSREEYQRMYDRSVKVRSLGAVVVLQTADAGASSARPARPRHGARGPGRRAAAPCHPLGCGVPCPKRACTPPVPHGPCCPAAHPLPWLAAPPAGPRRLLARPGGEGVCLADGAAGAAPL